jgi:CheY-like chemotaxis protein
MSGIYNFNGKKILVVEDEEINWLLLKDMLEETGAIMRWAGVGQEAIDLVASGEKFDLIIMDVKMPIVNGYEATRQIKKMDNTIPIVAYTAYAMPEEEQRCREAGCDDYLSKPVEMKDIYRIVSKYI